MKDIKNYFSTMLFFVFPIIMANVYYSDDLNRAMNGYTFWGIDGRPLADYLMIIINFSNHLTDLSPLPLLLATLLLSFTFYLCYKKCFRSLREGKLIPLSLLFSPFILEIFSYKFDVLTISASLSLCFSFLILRKTVTILQLLTLTASTIGIYGLYQPSINVALVFISLTSFIELHEKEPPSYIIKLLSLRLSAIIIGSIIYLKIILPFFFNGAEEANHPGIANHLLNAIMHNATIYYEFFTINLAPIHGEAITKIVFIVTLFSSAIISINYYKYFKNYGAIVIAVIAIVAIPLTFIASMASLLLLENPIENFPRVYIGINGLTLFCFALFCLACKNKWLNIAVFVFFGLYVLTFSYSYGNALRMQDELNQQLAQEIKLATKDISENSVNMMFNGKPPSSPVNANASINYPLIQSLVINYYYNWFGSHTYLAMHGLNQNYPDFTKEEVSTYLHNYCNSNLIYHSSRMNVYSNHLNIVVDFSKTQCE